MRVVGDNRHQGTHDVGWTMHIIVLAMRGVGDYRHQGTHDEGGGGL